MATAVTVAIDPGGTKDYTSLASADSDNFSTGTGGGHANGGLTSADLVSNDEALTIVGYSTDGAADPGLLDLRNFTVDATRNIIIDSDSGSRHNGKVFPTGNIFRVETTSGVTYPILIRQGYVIIRNIAVKWSAEVNNYPAVYFYDAGGITNATIENCIVQGNVGAYTGLEGIRAANLAGSFVVQNNVVRDFGTTGCIGISLGSGNTCTAAVRNNVVAGCTTGMNRSSGTFTPSNNIVWGSTTSFNGTMTSAVNNAYSQGSDPGSGGVDLSAKTAGDVFNDEAADDYSLKVNTGLASADSPCYRAGTNLYAAGVTTDIIGAARSASVTFDIGAFQTQTVTRTPLIDTGGTGDYTSLYSAKLDNFGLTSQDMVLNDENLSIEVRCTDGAEMTTGTTLDGFTCDVTHTLELYAVAPYKHAGKYPASGNVARFNGGTCIFNQMDYATFRGLALKCGATPDQKCIYTRYADGVTIEDCVGVDGGSTGGRGFYFREDSAAVTQTLRNCIATGFDTSGGAGIAAYAIDNGTVAVYNCVVNGCARGLYFYGSTSSNDTKNVVSFGNSGNDFDGFTTGSNCASEDGTGPATGLVSLSGLSLADIYNDAANGDYSLKVNTGTAAADSPLYRAGTNLYASGVTTDILGNARSASITFDIGAFQTQIVSREITVDPGGTGDYLDLQIAHDANFGCSGQDLVAQDETVKVLAICTNGTAFDNLVTDAGWTCNAAHRIWIDVPSAYRMGAQWKTGNYARIEKTTDACIVAQEANFKISGLAAQLTVTAGFPSICAMFAADWEVEDMLLSALNPGVGSEIYGLHTKVLGACRAKNIAVHMGAGATTTKYAIYENTTGGGTARYFNCSSAGSKWGHYIRSGNTTIVKNNVHFASATDYAGANPNAASEFNAFSVAAAATGSDWQDYSSKTAADYFTDWANVDLRLLIGNTRDGTNLYADSDLPVTTDIDGLARPAAGNFFIGASEYEGTAPMTADPDIPQNPGSARGTRKGKSKFGLTDDWAGWSLGQMFDPNRGAGA